MKVNLLTLLHPKKILRSYPRRNPAMSPSVGQQSFFWNSAPKVETCTFIKYIHLDPDPRRRSSLYCFPIFMTSDGTSNQVFALLRLSFKSDFRNPLTQVGQMIIALSVEDYREGARRYFASKRGPDPILGCLDLISVHLSDQLLEHVYNFSPSLVWTQVRRNVRNSLLNNLFKVISFSRRLLSSLIR